jgi:hypothetical protein
MNYKAVARLIGLVGVVVLSFWAMMFFLHYLDPLK